MLKLLCKLMAKVALRKGYCYITMVFLDNGDGKPYLSIRATAYDERTQSEYTTVDMYSFTNGRKWTHANKTEVRKR